MLRIARNNKIYKWLLFLTRKQRFVITIGIIFCIVASWFFLLHQPLLLRTRLLQSRLTNSIASTTTCNDLHAQSAQMEQGVNALEQQLETYKNENKQKVDCLTTIAKLARESTVCIDSCALEQSEEKQNFVVLPFAIKGHGTMAQLTDLLSKISITYAATAPSQITLEHIKNNIFQFNFRLNILKIALN